MIRQPRLYIIHSGCLSIVGCGQNSREDDQKFVTKGEIRRGILVDMRRRDSLIFCFGAVVFACNVVKAATMEGWTASLVTAALLSAVDTFIVYHQ